MNRKKTFWGVNNLSCHLECVFFGPDFYWDSGCMLFSSKAIRLCKLSSVYLLWDILNNTEKDNLIVALFPEHKPQNLPSNNHFNLSNATLRYAYSFFIWNDIVSNLNHVYLYRIYLSLLKTWMGKENQFNIRLLAFYFISLSLSLFIMNSSFVGNNKLYQ